MKYILNENQYKIILETVKEMLGKKYILPEHIIEYIKNNYNIITNNGYKGDGLETSRFIINNNQNGIDIKEIEKIKYELDKIKETYIENLPEIFYLYGGELFLKWFEANIETERKRINKNKEIKSQIKNNTFKKTHSKSELNPKLFNKNDFKIKL